ncbi:MAG: nucleotidyltransferase domain-containing protein [Bacteroidia bacterium]|jgi:predicted nucleotidyltransferase|nr:nucleotidyltransferase domain-containing protein [Bacteroidia bacterium]
MKNSKKEGQISEGVLCQLRKVLESHPKVQRALLFGSRAWGKPAPYADIDIYVEGLSWLEAGRLALELEELPIPYKVEVVSADSLSSEELRKRILEEGIEIFRRES